MKRFSPHNHNPITKKSWSGVINFLNRFSIYNRKY